MGEDSVKPFLNFPDKWAIVLGLTSNEGANNFQLQSSPELYKQVLQQIKTWGTINNLMFVVGATKAELFKEIRTIIPDNFLLVPGIGAQGGSLREVAKYGLTKDCGLLINASRSIIYASKNIDFDMKAADESKCIQQEMAELLNTIM
jgi:orotidine-5'-phosphate decarboxylase